MTNPLQRQESTTLHFYQPMHTAPPPHPLHPRIQQIFSSSWLPRWTHRHLQGISPAEDALALAIETLLWDEFELGRLRLERNIELESGRFSPSHYEVDFLITETCSGSRGIIEVDGHRFHRRDSEEAEYELRREHHLRYHLGFPLVRVSAGAVLADPWAVALEIISLLGHGWAAFQPVDVPPEVVSCIEGPAATASASPNPARPPADAANRVDGLLKRIRDHVSGLPSSAPDDVPNLERLREQHPRCYEPWSETEEQLLSQAWSAGLDVDVLSRNLQRQPGAIRARLTRLGIAPAQN